VNSLTLAVNHLDLAVLISFSKLLICFCACALFLDNQTFCALVNLDAGLRSLSFLVSSFTGFLAFFNGLLTKSVLVSVTRPSLLDLLVLVIGFPLVIRDVSFLALFKLYSFCDRDGAIHSKYFFDATNHNQVKGSHQLRIAQTHISCNHKKLFFSS